MRSSVLELSYSNIDHDNNTFLTLCVLKVLLNTYKTMLFKSIFFYFYIYLNYTLTQKFQWKTLPNFLFQSWQVCVHIIEFVRNFLYLQLNHFHFQRKNFTRGMY